MTTFRMLYNVSLHGTSGIQHCSKKDFYLSGPAEINKHIAIKH